MTMMKGTIHWFLFIKKKNTEYILTYKALHFEATNLEQKIKSLSTG